MSHITLGSELKKTNGYNILPIFYSKIKSFLLSQCKSRGGFVNIKKKKEYKNKKRETTAVTGDGQKKENEEKKKMEEEKRRKKKKKQ